MILKAYTPGDLPDLVEFCNRVFAGHRHWTPVTPEDLRERIFEQPSFDPEGLILAWESARLVGGVHALKPSSTFPAYQPYAPQHVIAWLAVAPDSRRQGVGSGLLAAAQEYLYYCPVYFAGRGAPLYGVLERLRTPWCGSTEWPAISAVNDRSGVDWLVRHGYAIVEPGDISLAASVHGRERPVDPGLAGQGLHIVPISSHSPWEGDEPSYGLNNWGHNGDREYHGFVLAEGNRVLGYAAWYPLPDCLTAGLVTFGLERVYRGMRLGAYLLERALVEVASRGYLYAETYVHAKENPAAYALYREREFHVLDYWVNLVKT